MKFSLNILKPLYVGATKVLITGKLCLKLHFLLSFIFLQCYTHKFLGWEIEVVDEFTDGAVPTTVSVLTLIVSMLLTIIVL